MLGQILELDEVVAEPVGVGMLGGELGLDLLVVDDAALRRVDQEDPARVQPFLEQHVLGRDVEHAHLGGHDDQAVLGHVVAGGPEPVPVEDAPITVPSVKAIEAGPSQGSISEEWYS